MSRRNVKFSNDAWTDFAYWLKIDRKISYKIIRLIDQSKTTPFEGIGKPEPLKENLSGYWSRRIDDEHRLVYKVSDNDILVASCRYHYDR